MAAILSVSGSPSAVSRTAHLLRHVTSRLTRHGHEVATLNVRTLPADALLGADFHHPAIVEAAARFEHADGVVIGTPVYKAAYSGLLKALLDLLPQYALAGKTVLPLATVGGRRTGPGHRRFLNRAARPREHPCLYGMTPRRSWPALWCRDHARLRRPGWPGDRYPRGPSYPTSEVP